MIARSKIIWHIVVKGHKIIENAYHEWTINLQTLLYFKFFSANPNWQQNINIKVHNIIKSSKVRLK